MPIPEPAKGRCRRSESRWLDVGILTAFLGVVLLVCPGGAGGAVSGEVMALRQNYNAVSAQIDSLVRQMNRRDPDAVKSELLPSPESLEVIPPGMKAVVVFWADDEARVWLNDFPLGQTRLTPVEIEVPSLYFRAQNQFRVRCWDTDEVESGLLLGLYLEDSGGVRRPVLVTDVQWQSEGGFAEEITYAHPVPNIAGAKVIWGDRMLGSVEFRRDFTGREIQSAGRRPSLSSPPGPDPVREKMDYHTFVAQLTTLQARREVLFGRLKAYASRVDPEATRVPGGSPGLTLGKSGPLRDDLATPVAEKALAWAKSLDEEDRRLVLPNERQLKGEGAATEALGLVSEAEGGTRVQDYRRPDDGSRSAARDPLDASAPTEAASGLQGRAVEGGYSEGGGGGGGAAPRLGLLIPTAALLLYVTFLSRQFRNGI